MVYYAVIDDKAQTYVPEMVTTKFDKIDRNAKTATTPVTASPSERVWFLVLRVALPSASTEVT